MPLRVTANNEVHTLHVESYEGPEITPKILQTHQISLPADCTITKIIAPFFFPTSNCPDEGIVYLFDDINCKWGTTKIILGVSIDSSNITVEPIRWFPL